MPQYLYENPKTGEIVEVIQRMTEPHVHIVDGLEYVRVFTVPQGLIDANISPWDQKKFVEKTGNAKGTYGDLISRSAEMSEKRAKESSTGVDPVRAKAIETYSKERKGRKFVDKM